MNGWEKFGLFAGGVLFGTAGISILSGRDARKVYTHCTAAVMRGKDSVMKTFAVLQENCGDIAADASDINEKRYTEDEEREYGKAKAFIEAYDAKKAEKEQNT